MAAALDRDDKVQAVIVWPGLLLVGPLVAFVVLALNANKRGSLARVHAAVAAVLGSSVFGVYVLAVVRTFVFASGSANAFPIVLATTYGCLAVIAAVGSVIAIRARIMQSE